MLTGMELRDELQAQKYTQKLEDAEKGLMQIRNMFNAGIMNIEGEDSEAVCELLLKIEKKLAAEVVERKRRISSNLNQSLFLSKKYSLSKHLHRKGVKVGDYELDLLTNLSWGLRKLQTEVKNVIVESSLSAQDSDTAQLGEGLKAMVEIEYDRLQKAQLANVLQQLMESKEIIGPEEEEAAKSFLRFETLSMESAEILRAVLRREGHGHLQQFIKTKASLDSAISKFVSGEELTAEERHLIASQLNDAGLHKAKSF